MGNRRWLEFRDSDYYFGTGVLRIDITATLSRVQCHDDRFFLVEGMEFCWDGRPLGLRRAYVRVSALAAAGVSI